MIETRELTKRFGGKTAVDQLSFTVRPGQVTGFLGAHRLAPPWPARIAWLDSRQASESAAAAVAMPVQSAAVRHE